MQKLIIIISILILCASCGVKENPEYKAQTQKNNKIYTI